MFTSVIAGSYRRFHRDILEHIIPLFEPDVKVTFPRKGEEIISTEEEFPLFESDFHSEDKSSGQTKTNLLCSFGLPDWETPLDPLKKDYQRADKKSKETMDNTFYLFEPLSGKVLIIIPPWESKDPEWVKKAARAELRFINLCYSSSFVYVYNPGSIGDSLQTELMVLLTLMRPIYTFASLKSEDFVGGYATSVRPEFELWLRAVQVYSPERLVRHIKERGKLPPYPRFLGTEEEVYSNQRLREHWETKDPDFVNSYILNSKILLQLPRKE